MKTDPKVLAALDRAIAWATSMAAVADQNVLNNYAIAQGVNNPEIEAEYRDRAQASNDRATQYREDAATLEALKQELGI